MCYTQRDTQEETGSCLLSNGTIHEENYKRCIYCKFLMKLNEVDDF